MENQNFNQDGQQGQNDEVAALKAQLEAQRAEIEKMQGEIQRVSTAQSSSFPDSVSVDKIPNGDEFPVFIRRHLEKYITEADQKRITNFQPNVAMYSRAIKVVRENWADYQRIIQIEDPTGRDMSIISEIRAAVNNIRSFSFRVPRDTGFKPLIDPNAEIFKFRTKREKFSLYWFYNEKTTNMAFQPGQSGNPAGRPPGAKAKVSSELADKLAGFLNEDFELFVKDWSELKPAERSKLRPTFYEFVLPKLSRGSLEFDLTKLSDSEIEKLLEIAVAKIANNELE